MWTLSPKGTISHLLPPVTNPQRGKFSSHPQSWCNKHSCEELTGSVGITCRWSLDPFSTAVPPCPGPQGSWQWELVRQCVHALDEGRHFSFALCYLDGRDSHREPLQQTQSQRWVLFPWDRGKPNTDTRTN